MTLSNIKLEIQASIDAKSQVLNNNNLLQQIADLAEECTSTLKAGGKIIFCGNGGSFADAQHLSAEFTSRFMFNRPGLASIALGTNSSAMTAIGNDYGYENVFAREIEAIATSNDVLIAITTSGNSLNILKAIEAAQEIKLPLFVFTGESNGKLQEGVTSINIPSSNTARIQECHILIGHIICGLVESNIFGNKAS